MYIWTWFHNSRGNPDKEDNSFAEYCFNEPISARMLYAGITLTPGIVVMMWTSESNSSSWTTQALIPTRYAQWGGQKQNRFDCSAFTCRTIQPMARKFEDYPVTASSVPRKRNECQAIPTSPFPHCNGCIETWSVSRKIGPLSQDILARVVGIREFTWYSRDWPALHPPVVLCGYQTIGAMSVFS